MIMNKNINQRIFKISMVFSFVLLNPDKNSFAMPAPSEYYYDHTVDNTIYSTITDRLKNNRAIILKGSSGKKITIGNEKVAKRYRSVGIGGRRLHLHHILFKGMRNTFPGIPYLCMQTPKEHHKKYHDDSQNTSIQFQSFSNMLNYLNQLKSSIYLISQEEDDEYSNVVYRAAEITVDCQKYWIERRYSWLYSVESGKYLLLAQRLIAKDCFPNQMISNKYICQSKVDYIREELALTSFTESKISEHHSVIHLKKALKARMKNLNIYVTNFNHLTSQQAYNRANYRYGDSERFYNPISHMNNLSGELSDASSLD